MRRMSVSKAARLALTLLCGTMLFVGCGSSDDSEAAGSGASVGSGASASSGASTGSGASASSGASTGSGASASGGTIVVGSGGTAGSTGTSGGSSGFGAEDSCDGIDNDGNGIIDDVDAGQDGVCDCLNIGTLGHIGPWSDGGNIFATWLNARSPQGAVELGDQVLTAELLAPLQVIVVLHVHTEAVSANGNNAPTAPAHHAFSDDETSVFEAWVRAGGGVMTTIGYFGNESAEVVNVNKLLSTVGAGYSTSEFGLNGFISNWGAHAVTDGLSNIFTDNGTAVDGAGTDVAWDGDDRVALEVLEADSGRVAVWGDEWITYDSEWADVEDQQVELFWLNLLKWLTPPNVCQVPIPATVK